MKKFLSLVLALVMTMSLVTISAGAKDFADDDKITYEEAIAVISEIGVVDGYEDGSFNPQGTLTRGAAAKIICNMILGPTTAAELHADTAPYSDVPINHTFAGYIAYCQKEGIISGYADGTFRPAGTLTGYAFMKMLLGALGYDSAREGYTGGNWSINVAKQALAIGLNKSLEGDFNGIKAVNREEAALYAFNTLKADLVEYSSTILVGDVAITGTDEKAMEWKNSATRRDNIKDDEYVQFAEQYFNKLVRTDDIDDFGRPANAWTYDKQDIGTYVNKDLLVTSYTAKVEGGEIYSDIGSAASKFDLTYYENGVELSAAATKTEAAKLVKNNEKGMYNSGNGVLTEVYVDTDKEETTIVEIHTYLAQANADYNSKTEKLSLTVYTGVNTKGMSTSGGTTPSETTIVRTVELEDFPQIEDYEDEDILMVTFAGTKKEIKSIEVPEVVSEVELSAYSTNGGDTDEIAYLMKSVTADGTKYSASKDAAWEAEYLYGYDLTQLKDHTWNIYLDNYGYALALENVEASTNYAFLIGYESGSSVLAKTIDKALVITIGDDETTAVMETVDIRDDDMDSDAEHDALFGAGQAHPEDAAVNKWVTYEMDGDVMILKTCVDEQFQDTDTTKIDKESATLEDSTGATIKYGNADSLYIAVDADKSVDTDGSIVDINGISVGIKNTSINIYDADVAAEEATKTEAGWTTNAQGAYVLYKNGYIKYAVVVGEDGSIADRLVYLTDDISEKRYDKTEDEYTYIYEGIIAGELNDEIISKVAKDTAGNFLEEGILYTASYDADGKITKMVAKTDNWADANTKENRDTKYVQATSSTSMTDKAGTTQTLAADVKLYLKGETLYITEDTNNHYVILDDECVFYISQEDEEGETDGYELFTSAKNALAALGNTDTFTGNFVAICDGNTGFATTIIIRDEKFETDEDTPAGVVSGDAAALSIVSGTTNAVAPIDIEDFGRTTVGTVVVANDANTIAIAVTEPTTFPTGYDTVATTLTVNGAAYAAAADYVISQRDLNRGYITVEATTAYTDSTGAISTALNVIETYRINITGTMAVS